MPPTPIFVSGRVLRTQGGYIAWDLLGVFSTQPLALAACTRTGDFWVQVNTDTNLQPTAPPVTGATFPNG